MVTWIVVIVITIATNTIQYFITLILRIRTSHKLGLSKNGVARIMERKETMKL